MCLAEAMKTLTAIRNDGRCPKCGDQTSEDRKGRGFVRHLGNPNCDFQRGEKDARVSPSEIHIGLEDTYRNRMATAIRAWMAFELEKYPGWRESNRKKFGCILAMKTEDYDSEPDFTFPKEMEDQRILIVGYLTLTLTVDSLRECQYYLRRFPFRDLPVTRSSHVINVCEMYFSRCYQFKQRLKNYLNALDAQVPVTLSVGPALKQFGKVFDRELKIRNQIHHHNQYSDITIDRFYLQNTAWAKDWLGRDCEYRQLTRFWIGEIRRTVGSLEKILEDIARLTLENCVFLSKFNVPAQRLQKEIEDQMHK